MINRQDLKNDSKIYFNLHFLLIIITVKIHLIFILHFCLTINIIFIYLFLLNFFPFRESLINFQDVSFSYFFGIKTLTKIDLPFKITDNF
jgi:hypothetical protein